jgi:hypothetical protein
VVVARARRDAAKVQLNRVQRQQERALLEIDFGSKGAKVVDAMALRFERLTAYLNAQLERAEATLALAEAKYELATAEQAMLHDLARYDLVEVKQNVELARRRLQGSREEVRKGRDALDRATSAFWQAYSRYVKDGGETLPFWIGSQSPQSIAQTDAKNRAPQAQSAPAPSDGGKKELPTNPF